MFSLQHAKLYFPFRQFLTQPVFDPRFKVVLNPRHFYRLHQIALFERCLIQECSSKDKRY